MVLFLATNTFFTYRYWLVLSWILEGILCRFPRITIYLCLPLLHSSSSLCGLNSSHFDLPEFPVPPHQFRETTILSAWISSLCLSLGTFSSGRWLLNVQCIKNCSFIYFEQFLVVCSGKFKSGPWYFILLGSRNSFSWYFLTSYFITSCVIFRIMFTIITYLSTWSSEVLQLIFCKQLPYSVLGIIGFFIRIFLTS